MANIITITRSDLFYHFDEEAVAQKNDYTLDLWEKFYDRDFSRNGGDYPAFSARLEFPSGWVVRHDYTSFGDWGEEHDIDVFSPNEEHPVYSHHFNVNGEENVHGNPHCWTLVQWAMTIAPEFF